MSDREPEPLSENELSETITLWSDLNPLDFDDLFMKLARLVAASQRAKDVRSYGKAIAQAKMRADIAERDRDLRQSQAEAFKQQLDDAMDRIKILEGALENESRRADANSSRDLIGSP